MSRASHAAIVALVRAGATDEAWRLFCAAGYDDTAGESVALTLRGRLLKDLAGRSTGAERRRLYMEAAASYIQAASLAPSTYALINAGSLNLIGGDSREAAASARAVLEFIEQNPDEPETPYWRAATRAEALLLLNRDEEARAAFAEAVGLAPQAWEDHASTLRQFGLILEAQGKDAAWLERHRPPRSIHFGGHMSFDPKVVRREHLERRIADVLEEERIGFGYGALAAGADIIIAETLLARGAELHAVLPGGAAAFAAVSVDPFGKAWRKRFDSVLSLAATVRAVRPFGATPDAMTIGLADEVAMGAAVMNARRLETSAVQLLVLPEEAPGSAPAHAHARWAEAGWRQRILTAPREPHEPEDGAALPSPQHRRLALLAIGAGSAGKLGEAADALKGAPAPAVAAHLAGDAVLLGYAEAAEAARAALAMKRDGGAPGIGGHYGVVDLVEDPFGGGTRILGEPAALASAAAVSAPPGAVCVTEDFAAAIAASGAADIHAEFIGELDPQGGGAPVALYALKPRL